MKLQRRKSPPPELNEEQEHFVRQFSFSCMMISILSLAVGPRRLTTVSQLVFTLYLALAMITVAAITFAVSESIGNHFLHSQMAGLPFSPAAKPFNYRMFIGACVIVLLAVSFALALRLPQGRSWRRKAWEDWQWPSFVAFVVDETRRSLLGIVYLVILLAFCGLLLLNSAFLL